MPLSLSLFRISARASTSFIAGTVSLIISAPASYILIHWATDASISDVWVLHMVCTTIG